MVVEIEDMKNDSSVSNDIAFSIVWWIHTCNKETYEVSKNIFYIYMGYMISFFF